MPGIAAKPFIRASFAALVLAAAAYSVGPASAQTPSEFANDKVAILNFNGVLGYAPVNEQKLSGVRERLQKRRILEEFKDFLAPLRLRKSLFLAAIDCLPGNPQLNAFYIAESAPLITPARRVIAICYHFAQEIDEDVTKLMDELRRSPGSLPKGITFSRQELVAGIFVGILLHELGHALFDNLDVPVFGRQEDAADQLSAYVSLQFSPEVARTVLKSFALFWRGNPDPPSAEPEKAILCKESPLCIYAGVHGTASQRMYNALCMAVGYNPALFKDFTDNKWLPPERVKSCANEYAQVKSAYDRTVGPFVDDALMRKVRARQWFQTGETEAPRR